MNIIKSLLRSGYGVELYKDGADYAVLVYRGDVGWSAHGRTLQAALKKVLGFIQEDKAEDGRTLFRST